VGYPDNWALWLRAQGVDPSGLRLTGGFDLGAGLVEAVAAGMGVAVVQPCLIEHELAQGRVVVPVPGSASTGRGYFLCIRRAQPVSAPLEAFSRWLLAQAKAAGG
jgi:LysR family transcriptional regulator, glycine cleavage system transcriptional activator